MNRNISRFIACASLLGLAQGAQLNAAIIFNLSEVVTGDRPAGETPWLRATFEPGVAAGTVALKMEAVHLTGSENAVTWGFNLVNGITYDDLVIESVDAHGFSTVETKFKKDKPPEITPVFTLDDGTVPPVKGLEFHWEFPPGSSDTAVVFDSTDWVTVILSSSKEAGLKPEDFLGLSELYNGKQYYSVAHIQNTTAPGGDDSGKIGALYTPPTPPPGGVVPEPSTYLAGLAGLGMLGASFLRRRA